MMSFNGNVVGLFSRPAWLVEDLIGSITGKKME